MSRTHSRNAVVHATQRPPSLSVQLWTIYAMFTSPITAPPPNLKSRAQNSFNQQQTCPLLFIPNSKPQLPPQSCARFFFRRSLVSEKSAGSCKFFQGDRLHCKGHLRRCYQRVYTEPATWLCGCVIFGGLWELSAATTHVCVLCE